MDNFADRLLRSISMKGNPCVVGLDPRLDLMPAFVRSREGRIEEAIRRTIVDFHKIILEVVAPLVPAVKLQAAFYEQYGIPGLNAFVDTIQLAREMKLVVVVDAKRNDIASTAEAYANAFLGRTDIFGTKKAIFDVDCITVSPFLGRDSLQPFVDACGEYGKGIFVLVKTSNPGSVDLQDQELAITREPLYNRLAETVDELGSKMVGESGYSAIGAVVGATFPEEAVNLRRIMPRALILVPGYGAQGGTADDAMPCFNSDGLGAVINASRSITYAHRDPHISKEEFIKTVRSKTTQMINEVRTALKNRLGAKK